MIYVVLTVWFAALLVFLVSCWATPRIHLDARPDSETTQQALEDAAFCQRYEREFRRARRRL